MTRISSIRRQLLTTAGGVILCLAMHGVAQAQTTAPESAQGDDDTIVVTGLRAAIDNTIATKKNASQIVESISAEDIGKLPDQSIAEAIARLPGLAAQRVDGRSQSISIRGLSPDFSTTLLNGREQVSTGDNRSAEYDQYPSELIAGVTVYKTPTADLIGQGLSGTVDMKTIRPLDYKKSVLSLNVRGEGGTLGKINPDMPAHGWRASATYVGQFLNDTLGIMIGANYMQSPQQYKQYESWGYTTLKDGNRISNGAKLWNKSDNLRRASVVFTAQYKPTTDFESSFDFFYSKFNDKVTQRGGQIPFYSSIGAGGLTLVSSNATDGFVDSGTYSGVKTVIQQGTNRRNSDLFSIGWNNKLTSGRWTTMLDFAWSGVNRRDRFLSSYAGTGRWGSGATDTMSFTTDGEGVQSFDGALDYGSYDTILLGGPQNWGGYDAKTGNGVPGYQDGYLTYRTNKDDLYSGNLSTEADFGDGFLTSLKLGLRYARRTKSLDINEHYLSLTDSYNSYRNDGTFVSVAVPSAYQLGTVSLSRFGFDQTIAYDLEGLLDNGYYTQIANLQAPVSRPGWHVREDTFTGYVRGNLATEIAGLPITGNVGVQVVGTDQRSNSSVGNQATYAVSPTSGKDHYIDVLPSLNIAANLTETLVLRLAASRTVARPRMDQMAAYTAYTFSPQRANATELINSPWSGTGGNIHLRPWRANTADVSLEFYPGRGTYVALAGFYKDLKNYIYQSSTLYDFTGFGTDGLNPVLSQGYVTRWVNGNGGQIKGVEFSLSVPARALVPALDGFGVSANLSYTDSNVTPDPTNPATTLPGMSKLVSNATIYFEKNGFSARLNHSYRSRFLGQVTAFDSSLTQKMIKAQNWLDGQISYTLPPTVLHGATLLFQMNNITGESIVSYLNNDERQLSTWQNYGRQFLAGVSVKF